MVSNPRWVEAGLNPAVIDVLSSKGITVFTPVQGEAFHPVLEGRDVIGRSRTGTCLQLSRYAREAFPLILLFSCVGFGYCLF